MIKKKKNEATLIYRIACLIASIFVLSASAKAQIGYQVSLLNKATGEPRANVTVTANVTITDSSDGIVYTGSQRATSNDFGVLSLAVGDANTFSNFDTGKMPLYISVSVDGVLIGKTQILSVPVAEIANKLKSSFTKENLVGTWKMIELYDEDPLVITFNSDNTYNAYCIEYDGEKRILTSGTFVIEGNTIYLYSKKGLGIIRYVNGSIYINYGNMGYPCLMHKQ